MAIHVSEVSICSREVLLRDKPDAMLEVSPKGTVPVLVLKSGEVIDESLEIMRWALAQHDPKGLLHAADESLIRINDQQFKNSCPAHVAGLNAALTPGALIELPTDQ